MTEPYISAIECERDRELELIYNNVCPKCEGKLLNERAGLICQECGESY